MKTAIVALLGLAISASAFAADAPSTTSSADASTWQKLKDGPLSLSVLHETGTKNSAGDYNGNSTLNILYVGYKLTDNDSVKLENRYSTTNVRPAKGADKESEGHWSRHVLSYKRSNILTEKEDGIGLSSLLEYRAYVAGVEKAGRNQYGLGRISATASKSFGKLSTSNTIYYARMNQKDSSIEETQKSYLYGAFSQTYSFTDKFSLAVLEELFHDYSNNGLAENQTFDLTVEAGYQVTPDFGVWINTATTLMSAHDGDAFVADLQKNMNYGIGFSYTAF